MMHLELNEGQLRGPVEPEVLISHIEERLGV